MIASFQQLSLSVKKCLTHTCCSANRRLQRGLLRSVDTVCAALSCLVLCSQNSSPCSLLSCRFNSIISIQGDVCCLGFAPLGTTGKLPRQKTKSKWNSPSLCLFIQELTACAYCYLVFESCHFICYFLKAVQVRNIDLDFETPSCSW